jgi:dTMP kinase
MFLTNPEMSFKTQLLLINAGRNDHMEKVVRPALNSKAVVVSERSVLSCYAYQVHKKIDEQDFDNIVSIIGQDVIPFKTFYIRIKYETSQNRISNRTGAKDVIEQKPKEFFDNLIDGFEYLYHSELGSDFILIDGELPLEKVKDQIRSELIKLIPYL